MKINVNTTEISLWKTWKSNKIHWRGEKRRKKKWNIWKWYENNCFNRKRIRYQFQQNKQANMKLFLPCSPTVLSTCGVFQSSIIFLRLQIMYDEPSIWNMNVNFALHRRLTVRRAERTDFTVRFQKPQTQWKYDFHFSTNKSIFNAILKQKVQKKLKVLTSVWGT